MIRNLTLIFLVCSLFIKCEKSDEEEKISIKDVNYKNLFDEFVIETDKYSDEFLSKKISLPIIYDLEFFVNDIIDFKTNKSDYILKSNMSYSYDEEMIKYKNDTIIDFYPEYFMTIIYEGSASSDDVIISDTESDGKFFFEQENDSLFQWSNRYIEAKFYHNWQLKDYPFDIQELRFKIQSDYDTSLVRLRQSKEFPPLSSENLSLPEGFNIRNIEFEENFVESNLKFYDDNIDDFRNVIYSEGNFIINVARDGGALFFKLFMGAILSLILSISVFYIPKKDFDSRSQIAIGAIFAAVGNKYFVDSSTISNVMSVADIINNTIIFLVIMNVFIMIAQRNDNINWKWLEEDKNAVKLSIGVFLLISISIFLLYV